MSGDDEPANETVSVNGPVAPGPTVPPVSIEAPPYHQALRVHLESTEPELWAWFQESADPSPDSQRDAEVDLLKTAYRLDGGLHDVLTGYASLVAGQLDLTGAITLYQELGTDERNARVLILGDDVHVVFGGDLLDLLDLGEQQAVLAHELAHVALWQREEKAYWVLDQLVHRLAADPTASDAVGETARRLRLHTEVFADAVSIRLTDEPNDVISAVVKVNSGLRSVDPEAYRNQARQILEADPSSSRGWTHPELHVRVACMAAQTSSNTEALVSSLIEGPDDLDRVDLLGQLRLTELTGQVLGCGLRVSERSDVAEADDAESAGDELRSHIEMFPSEVRRLATLDDPAKRRAAVVLDDGALSEHEPSVRHLCGALLVDVALAGEGRATSPQRLAPVAREAERLGVGKEFDKILARATDRTVREVRKLHAGGADE